MVTVNEVKVSRDLAYADVYFTILTNSHNPDENQKQGAEVLNNAAGFLRSQLAKILSTRTTPRLRFYYDHTIENGARLSKAIDDAVRQDKRNRSDSKD